MRHTLNSINNNYKNALIRWVDTDVFVLLISYTGQVELNDIEIHVFLINSTGFTTSNIIQELGSDIFLALPFFYSFTKYDTVLSFYDTGKRKACDGWVKSQRKDDFTDVFVEFGENPTDRTSDQIDMLKNSVLQLNGLRHDTLGPARLDKFKKSTDNDFRLIPPSKEALRQYFYRAFFQAGYLWRQFVEELDIPTLNNGV